MKYLTREDFYRVVDLADHCDDKKLSIAIEEALHFDLKEALCPNYGYFYELLTSEKEKTDLEYKILNGDTYHCGPYSSVFLGLKRMWVYYSFARYVSEVHFVDTGLGLKQKTDQFSMPTPLKEINAIRDVNRNKAIAINKQLKDFLCHYREELPGNVKQNLSCKSCGCQDSCSDRSDATDVFSYEVRTINGRIIQEN